jgi:hypothetical protein
MNAFMGCAALSEATYKGETYSAESSAAWRRWDLPEAFYNAVSE